MTDFNSFLMRAGLSDAGYSGNDYTWYNNRQGDEAIWERLDRFLVNGTFLAHHSSPRVSHLPMTCSDHCPILFEGDTETNRGSRFHYLRMWEKHPGFHSYVTQLWQGSLSNNPLQNFSLKLAHVRRALRKWNWEVFGDIRVKEYRVTDAITAAEKDLQQSWSEEGYNNLKHHRKELEELLQCKEELAKGKSRIAWLRDGDRNTAFFHAAIRERRGRNRMSLRREDGSFTSDSSIIGEEAVRFYQSLLSGYTPPPQLEDLPVFPRTISDEQNNHISELPDSTEILNAIKGMNSDGAPGPDGFSIPFYLHFWNVIKEDFTKAVRAFFYGLHLPKSWTATTLTLIPKVLNASRIDQLRPISLCNVSHKVISRILNNRIAPILPQIISENQAGFIVGRSIHSNIALAHDLTHDLNKKGKDGNVIIKLDMSKAYDRVSWPFLIRMLRAFGFKEQWCDLVYRCISNIHYSVSWDGGMFGFFKSSCGVRQGDPLSPSLFILTMDWLSRALNDDIRTKITKPYDTRRHALKISHLMFADDVLIFSKDCPQSTANLLVSLRKFCRLSGQVLNPAKSNIFLAKDVLPHRKQRILELTGFLEGSLPTNYLGVPLMQGRIKKSYFNVLLDKLRARIGGWMRNFLSMAGRLTLINSVLQSLSFHTMAVLPIPKGVIRKMEQIIANFLWDHGNSKHHHWVRMEIIARPKESGGLNIRSLADIMLAFQGKLAWEYLQQESLWARFARSRFESIKRGSPIWNSLSHLVEHLRENSLWQVGDGSELIDKYCFHFRIPCKSDLKGLTIRYVLSRSPQRGLFLAKVPTYARDYYVNAGYTMDKAALCWLGHASGSFTSKHLLYTFRTHYQDEGWGKSIWQRWIPPKISLSVWRIIHNGLPLDPNIKRMGIPLPSRCSCCYKEEENLSHLFLKGAWAVRLWDFLSDVFHKPKPSSLNDLTSRWFQPSKNPFDNLRIGLSCFGLRDIWTLRNNARHDEQLFDIIASVYNKANQVSRLLKGIDGSSTSRRRVMLLLHLPYPTNAKVHGKWRAWKPGIVGSTLNLFVPSETNIGVGAALFRSKTGNFQFAFSFKVGNSRNLDYLIQAIDNAIERGRAHNIEVKEIQCSHYHMMTTSTHNCDPKTRDILQKYKDITFRRIHTRINHAALAIAFTTNPPCGTLSARHLPKPAFLCIVQDKTSLPQFCMDQEEDPGGSHIFQVQDDLDIGTIARDSYPAFIDDSNI